MGVSSLVGSVAGPLISSALGGDSSGAVGAQVQGAQQASAINDAAIKKAIDEINQQSGIATNDLTNYYGAGQQQVLPYQNGGYAANDMLLEQLGVPHAQNSIQYLNLLDEQKKSTDYQNSLKQQQDLQTKLQGITHSNDIAAYERVNHTAAPFAGDDITGLKGQALLDYAKTQQQNYAGDVNSLTGQADLKSFWGGLSNNIGDLSQYDLLGKDLGPAPTAPTADQQAMLDRYAQGDFTGAGYNGVSTSATAPLQKFLDSTPYQLLYGNGGPSQDANATALQRFQASPGYQFSLDQGVKARDASAAARGMLLSGNQQQDLATFGTGLANQEYNQYQGNLSNTYGNWLANLSGVSGTGANISSGGRAAANATGSNLSNVAMQTGNSIAGLYQSQGQTDANAALAAANATASGYLSDAKQQNQLAGSIGNSVSKFLTSPGFSNGLSNFFSPSASNTPASDPLPNYLRASSY